MTDWLKQHNIVSNWHLGSWLIIPCKYIICKIRERWVNIPQGLQLGAMVLVEKDAGKLWLHVSGRDGNYNSLKRLPIGRVCLLNDVRKMRYVLCLFKNLFHSRLRKWLANCSKLIITVLWSHLGRSLKPTDKAVVLAKLVHFNAIVGQLPALVTLVGQQHGGNALSISQH